MDVTWDSGGSNSYRMGAEGKFDLALAPIQSKPPMLKTEQGAVGGMKIKSTGTSTDKIKVSLVMNLF